MLNHWCMCLPQFRPGTQAPQGQPFMSPQTPPQFHPSGQPQSMGMPPGQSQLPPFSQPMQQFMPRPAQPGHAAPSSYPQPSMPMSSGMAQPQSAAPGQGVPFPSSYTVRTMPYIINFVPGGQEYFFGIILLILFLSVCAIFFWLAPDKHRHASPISTFPPNVYACRFYWGTTVDALRSRYSSCCTTAARQPAILPYHRTCTSKCPCPVSLSA